MDLVAAERALAAVPARFAGPGGVAGIVHRGRVVARAAWGWADMARRVPMGAGLRLPVCSITKQFTCAALLDAVPDPSALDARVGDLLPALATPCPTVAQLAHNQSGLRDSWALTVVMGAQPEGRFTLADAPPLFARMRGGHFAPGRHYAYSNGNFRLLSDLLESATGREIGAHYARLFDWFGMATAALDADTARPADGVVGYEGTPASGFLPATNRIWWQGDAGIAASLDDMLAYETAIDAGRDDASAPYARLSAPVAYGDGSPATYGWGLARETIAGAVATGHGGALRGFRAQRFHLAAHRLSVVVMFNHEASAHAAAASVIAAALGQVPAPSRGPSPAPDWSGTWLDPGSGLLLTVADGAALFATGPEPLVATADGAAASPTMRITRDGDALRIVRPRENLVATAVPAGQAQPRDIAGRYVNDEIAATLHVTGSGDSWWGAFDGPLGHGPAQPMTAEGRDLWSLWTRRGMDAPAPGRWTVQIRRAGGDRHAPITGLTLGCWLARGLEFRRQG